MSDHEGHLPSREQLAALISRPIAPRLKQVSLVLAILGLLVFVAGIATGQERAWHAWHVNWLFFTVIASAGVMLSAVQRITTARWSRSVIRISEANVSFLPIAFVMLVVTIVAGRTHIFPWTHEAPTQPEKALWLDPMFWSIRGVVVFGLLTALSLWFVYTAVRLDVGVLPEWGANWGKGIRARMRRGFGDERRELHTTHSLQGRLAVILALAFGFGWVMLSWDLSMSIDPHFQSTMYGWQFFIGGWLANIMLLSMLVRFWRNQLGAHEVITDSHFHDIGKLAFGFTAFWGYLTFSQLLVIWYGNLAEESHFFRLRLIAPWTSLTVSVVFLTFVLPFFGLLGKFPKLFAPTMVLFASMSLLGIWIHRYLEIYPVIYQQTVATPPIGLWEIGIFLGYLGLWGFSYLSFMDAFPRMRVFMMTSPYRDEIQVPCDPKTMEPLPAHE
ncbi:MAG TPA: hypothetical protein VF981_10230 [Gemmatimonadaceae bacterium]